MSYLVILTFGSPQAYISQARRTQDLLQGSRILSHLADKAVDYVVREHQPKDGIELIYPVPQDIPSDKVAFEIAGTPNRIVVLVEDEASGIALAKGMEKSLRDTWNNLSGIVFDYFNARCLPDKEGLKTVTTIWNRQVDSWLDVYWVVQADNGMDYAEHIEAVSANLASRKMFRNFGQIAEYGRKCSITGEHEALYDGKSYVDFWKDVRIKQKNLSLFGLSERLSAIATIKRLAHERKRDKDRTPIYESLKIDYRFPSTSSIASIPFKFDVLKAIATEAENSEQLKKAVEDYIETLLVFFDDEKDLFFNIGNQWNPEYFGFLEKLFAEEFLSLEWVQRFRSIDGDFLYEDTLISTTIEEYSGKPPKKHEIRQAKKALEELVKQARKCHIISPQPYYVILSMDGDNMGKLLGCIGSPQDHRLFSETLADYAYNDVIDIVQNKHLGRVVYAGGDDVMAVLPVQDALKVANDLRIAFSEKVNNAGILKKTGQSLTATASTGLAFVHHTHNLQQAVNEANNAQKNDAKKDQDRDALAVRLLRRSGERREMQHDWLVDSGDLTDRIQALVKQFSDGLLGRSLPYDVSQIHYAMTGNNVPKDAREAELSRVIKRRLPQGQKEQAESITNNILALAKNKEIDRLSQQWLNVLRWLELARFIAQSTDEEETS